MITEGMGWFVCCVRTWIGTDNCQRRAMRKTKSVHGSGCGWGDGFSEKKEIPKHILAFDLISSSILHNNGNSHCTAFNRPSGADTAFRATRKVSCPILDLWCFFSPPKRLLFVGYPVHSLHSCTVCFFFRCRYDTLPPGIFDTLALWSVQECKECMGVITEIYADTAVLSAFSALSNSKMRIMQVMQMFFLFIAP